MEQSKTTSSEEQIGKSLHSLRMQILEECEAMASYAFRSGLKVPVSVIQTLEKLPNEKSNGSTKYEKEVKDLVTTHGKLSELVAPATPRSIIFLGELPGKNGVMKFQASSPIIRNMAIFAGFFLISFILLSLSPFITSDPEIGDPFISSGMELLINELFILTAAGIGATFAALFEANKYLVSYTFEPKYSYSYWIKIGLGLISGFILAELIPLDEQTGSMSILGRPTLAMLGGFSATIVYRILKRLVNSLESIFKGDVDQQIERLEEEAKIQNQGKLTQLRFSHTSNLLQLKKTLADKTDSKELQQKLDSMLEEMIPQLRDQ
ncbi:hypothetical protein NC796_10885 [Aliifodinibius sp. S!AR15-10]|uniref:hypothetical protein n=1 Tax=Aliifodinibius sp. S!AR15-10 TaxID=2950437 RepID=UPI002858FD91|nr:hypothetical protein [Aliifodinibius sp. S!AR15-10]MDR8391649.1 hypothetical protein [Aliifodinibius sp. S!AR15-10]